MRCDLIPSLDEYLAGALERAFQYGTWDCLIYTMGWVKIATGVDHLAGVEPYTTLAEGQAILAARGFASWQDAVASVLEEQPPLFARRADIVSLKTNGALGICLGASAKMLLEDKGMIDVSILDCARAWKVL